MGPAAHVSSIEAVRAFRPAVVEFEAAVRDAVEDLLRQSRRAVEWLENDRARYWPHEVRKASEAVCEARINLEQRRLRIRSEETPSCFEQEKALQTAQQRLRTAERKAASVRRWLRTVRYEVEQFKGKLANMASYLDTDLPRALAALDRIIGALDKYLGRGAPRPVDEPSDEEPK